MAVHMRWARVAALLVGLISSPAVSGAAEISHDQNLEDFLKYVDEMSARIEDAGVASQKAGDAGLAQQQFLIHEIVKRAAGEVRYLKQPALTAPIHDLTSSEVAKLDDFADLLSHIDYSDEAKIVDTRMATQSRVDALLDVMAGGRIYPILFGMLTRDLMAKPESAPADLEIIGHNLIDPTQGKNPAIKVAGADVPANFVTVKGESVLVDLPDATKDAVGFSPTPCRPRNPFTVRATAFHGDPHGVWPIRWVTELESNADFVALPSPRVYEFSVSYNFERVENTLSTEKFSNRSDYVVAACGEAVATTVRYEAPAGARDLSCQVSWAESTGAKSSTKSCRVAGQVAEAHGALTGPDPTCSPDKVCGCVVNARGWLQIDGSFKRDNITVLSRTASLPGRYTILANDSTSVPLQMEAGSKLQHIGILINRRSCPAIHGRLDIQFSNDGRQIMAGVSRNGAFHANYVGNQLTVVNATTESSDASDNSN